MAMGSPARIEKCLIFAATDVYLARFSRLASHLKGFPCVVWRPAAPDFLALVGLVIRSGSSLWNGVVGSADGPLPDVRVRCPDSDDTGLVLTVPACDHDKYLNRLRPDEVTGRVFGFQASRSDASRAPGGGQNSRLLASGSPSLASANIKSTDRLLYCATLQINTVIRTASREILTSLPLS